MKPADEISISRPNGTETPSARSKNSQRQRAEQVGHASVSR